jgi:Tfp pilus assembly protein PilX
MRVRNNQNGFVSLFTCIMISLLLLVITVSLVTLETLQLRKSEDAEQTLRAYYTAEAGAEDAVSKVLAKAITPGTGDKVCNKNTTYDGAAGWTCQQVSFSGSPTGKVDVDSANTIDPGKQGYNSVIVEWNQSAKAGGYNMAQMLAGNAYTVAQYTSNGYSAPPLELSMLEYPDTGFDASEVCTSYAGAVGGWQPAGCKVRLQNALLVPNGTTGLGVADYGAPSLIPSFNAHGPYSANCGPLPRTLPPALGGGALSYNCYAVIKNLNVNGNPNFLIRIRSRYAATEYKLIFKANVDGGGATVQVPDGTATIDVTAKSGQTYRRVISKLPLNSGASSKLNFVMYADNNICKNFDVINDAALPGCPY